MGLIIHSLGELPANAHRGFYVYLLDYGWRDGLAKAMRQNFNQMAREASDSDAVVMRGMTGDHFADEVLSWHHVNGEDAAELLPAILISTTNPHLFRRRFRHQRGDARFAEGDDPDRLLLIPLRSVCQQPGEVPKLLEGIFRDIRQKERLSNFEVARRMEAGKNGALRDALVLQRSAAGGALPMGEISAFLRPAAKDPTRRGPTGPQEALMQPDILVITVNGIETTELLQAVQQATGTQLKHIPTDTRTYRDLGTINGTTVFHALSSAGSGGPAGAQQTVARAIESLAPRAIVAVGVAFGIDARKQRLGDVLLSTQLSLYELQRVGTNRDDGTRLLRTRGDKPSASPRLVDYFKGIAMTSALPHGLRVQPGLLLSGEKLVDNMDYRKELQAMEPEAIGGEMEGAGIYTSAHDSRGEWIVIKAICDWADGNKGKNKQSRQRKAAMNAAAFFVHALTTAKLPSPTRSRSPNQTSNPSPTHSPNQTSTPPDLAILEKFTEVIARPAFTTDFSKEDDFAAFKQAITDTIEALNTGVWRLRDGTPIERIQSRHRLRQSALKDAMAEAVEILIELRVQFNELVSSGDVQPCGCGKPDCKVFIVKPAAAQIMDDFRGRFLHQLHDAVEAAKGRQR